MVEDNNGLLEDLFKQKIAVSDTPETSNNMSLLDLAQVINKSQGAGEGMLLGAWHQYKEQISSFLDLPFIDEHGGDEKRTGKAYITDDGTVIRIKEEHPVNNIKSLSSPKTNINFGQNILSIKLYIGSSFHAKEGVPDDGDLYDYEHDTPYLNLVYEYDGVEEKYKPNGISIGIGREGRKVGVYYSLVLGNQQTKPEEFLKSNNIDIDSFTRVVQPLLPETTGIPVKIR